MNDQPKDAIYHLHSVEDLQNQLTSVVNRVREKNYALLRGLFNRNEIRDCRKLIYESANHRTHLASAGVDREMVRKNISKWSIGSQSATQTGISRCMLTLHNPLFCDDIFKMRAPFRTLIMVRDVLAQRDEPLFDEKLRPPLFNGARIQIYPKGGGFMTAHRDTRAEENLKGVSDAYFQLILLVSERGTDYQSGGAFVIDKNGAVIDTEKATLSGDVLVYDGNTMHGVLDIDPTQPFTTSDLAGRAVALVTVYN